MIHKYFFAPGSAVDLGISRFLFYLWFFVQIWMYNPIEYSMLPSNYWDPVFILIFFDAPTPQIMTYVVVALSITTLCAAIGFLTRLATISTAILGVYAFGCIESYGLIAFHFSPMIMISCILPFSRCGDAWSIDSLFRKKYAADLGEYRWPVKLCHITFIALMFTAGCHKVFGTWLFEPLYNMEYWILHKFYAHSKLKGNTIPEFTLVIAQCKPILLLMAFTMIVGEFCSPLALIDKKPLLRFFMIALLFSMQLVLSIYFKTIPTFPWLGAYLFFIPWERLSKQIL